MPQIWVVFERAAHALVHGGDPRASYNWLMSWRVSSRPGRSLPASFITPCLATDAAKVPSGDGWAHEIKHDGYRMQVRRAGGIVRLLTRRGADWTARYPWPVEAARGLRAQSFTLDGELVVAGADGISDFEMLQSRVHDHHAFVYAFDLLELNGVDLRKRPLSDRKAALAKLLAKAKPGIRFCEHDEGDGEALFLAACRMGLEGIVSKRLASPYVSKRTKSWVKIKNPKAPGYRRGFDDV